MKFEFDHRTGMMQPKKDDQIYFAKSQGGGLIIDDKKNNIKYIIERDERITKLFGSFDKDSLNFYDMRDARMISDRVIRMFGRDHKYTDYHYFLKGYHMNENFVQKMEDFLDESVWSDIQDKSTGDVISKEEGAIIGELEDGTKLILPRSAFEDGDIVEFDDSKIYFLDDDNCIAVITDGETDTYYRYDKDSESVINMVKGFQADSILRTENEFGPLKALMYQNEWDENTFNDFNFEVRVDNDIKGLRYFDFIIGDNCEFFIFNDYDRAKEYAVDYEENSLENNTEFTEEIIKRFRQYLGDGFFNTDSMEREIKESEESYYDGLDEEEAIDLLLQYEIIEDTEEYFELDENGETDHTLPKFNYVDYEEKFVEKYMEGVDDVVDYFLSNFGYDDIEDYINIPKLAKSIVDNDGCANTISSYDGKERTEKIDGTTYYIYRID